MPFTPAHTAIVLPFLRVNFLPATALVIGSMSPDFEYFLKFSVDGIHGHTWPGLFYFDLPLTFILAAVYHQVVRKNLIQNLPAFLQSRIKTEKPFDFLASVKGNWLGFAVAALLGAASHILWDGFTHGNGFFVRYFDFYDGAYVPFQGVDYPLWYALQHISTVVGLIIVAFYVLALPPKPNFAPAGTIYWVMIFAISIAIVALRFFVEHSDFNLGNFVVSSISGFCVALVICGLLPSRLFRHRTME